MRTIVYGFFKDEMRGSHSYVEVLLWLFFFFIVDLLMPLIVDPFSMEGNFIILDLIEADDILPIFFLTLVPWIYFFNYKSVNGFAVVQAMFLYVFFLGWLPILYEEFFFYDSFYLMLHLVVLFEYMLLHEDEEIDDVYDEAQS